MRDSILGQTLITLTVITLTVFGLVLGAHALRIESTVAVQHDDGISHLAATAHQGTFEESAPSGRWVPVADWARFWHLDDGSTSQWATIGRDLARHDLHPPLYFWLLHAWIAVVGTHAWTGPTLNLAFVLLTALALLALARSLLPPRLAALALLVVLAWGVAPAVLRVTGYTRQYALLTLWTVVLALCLARALSSTGPSWSARVATLGCGLAAACGLLTHLQFAVPLAASAALAGLAARRPGDDVDRRRAWGVLLALGLGAVTAVALHPALVSFTPGGSFDVEVSARAFAVRILRVVAALLTFVTARTPLAYGLFVLAAVAFVVVLRTRRAPNDGPATGSPSSERDLRARRRLVLRFTAWTLCGVVGLYLAFLSPQHAMADRYLAFVYPLLAVVLMTFVLTGPKLTRSGLTASLSTRARVVLVAIVCLSQLTQGLLETTRHRGLWQERTTALDVSGFADARRILLDSSARGVVPTVLWHAADDAVVFAAPQEQLLAEPAAWLDDIDDSESFDGGAVYVSDLRYGNSADQREQILELLAARGITAEPVDGGVYGLAALYRLRPAG